MKGSCLCGKCKFEIEGELGQINKCHCTKCRKVSGTGSNAVLWIEPNNLKWIGSEDYVKTHEMEDGWQSVFCRECGSPLPRLISAEAWIVPAGVLDEELEVVVRAHIYVENNPPWEVIGDDALQYQQVPSE
ncbi:MAG: GFA family protein [Proteobacteria bacterium]|nr:GFA family protein [Pseudomonadota bacterium]